MSYDETKYWYNLNTGEVEFGMLSPGSVRVGPFNSLDEAKNAPELLRQRAKAWADEDATDSRKPNAGGSTSRGR